MARRSRPSATSKARPERAIAVPVRQHTPEVLAPEPAQPARDVPGELARARAIAATLAPVAVQRLGHLTADEDARVAIAACEGLRRWTEQAPGAAGSGREGGNMTDYEMHKRQVAEAQSIRREVEAAMHGSTEDEIWARIEARLQERGLRLLDACTIEELEEVVTPGPGGRVPLPPPFRRMKDPNPRPPLT